jgi:hypothetical protein
MTNILLTIAVIAVLKATFLKVFASSTNERVSGKANESSEGRPWSVVRFGDSDSNSVLKRILRNSNA